MTNYRRRATREWRVALSNGESLRIIATTPQRAIWRAAGWCARLNKSVAGDAKVIVANIVEVEN